MVRGPCLDVSLGDGRVDDPPLLGVHVHFRSSSVVEHSRVRGDRPEKLTVPRAPHACLRHVDVNEGFWAVQGWKSHVGLPLLLPSLMEVQVHVMRNGALTLREKMQL